MKLLEKTAIMVGLVMVGATMAYRKVLTEDQRDALREATSAVSNAAQEVIDTVRPLVSDKPTKREEEAMAEANRDRTAKQWESLGY